MYFSTSTVLAVIACTLSLAVAAPVPCTDTARDAVLNGHMDKSVCCVEGLCLTGSNSASEFVKRNTGPNIAHR
ncbi:hypothetical protein BJ875DRAFT_490157 [Amylocarpus encephaloides]|uniref:Uncharacterized protein n=1 Tax=Amylocarpus encephaloides TaxID=45428 RepID=A0A9P8C0H5_9HELO|nr:hypothetical protein BJ875DRAFT_490157 [Amylocarpus encephaloides]